MFEREKQINRNCARIYLYGKIEITLKINSLCDARRKFILHIYSDVIIVPRSYSINTVLRILLLLSPFTLNIINLQLL